jgi:putative transcriptional regulator
MTGWVGRLVVATPVLTDPNFARTVVLLLQHDDEDGALGVVLNRPSGTGVAEVLPSWEPLAAVPPVVYAGGPVQPEAAICLGRAEHGTPAGPSYAPLALPDGPDPQLGTVDLDADPVPGLLQVRVFAGYAGWSPQQLEAEVAEGAWWVLDALPGDAFVSRPQDLWSLVLRRQGLPLALMATATADPRLN